MKRAIVLFNLGGPDSPDAVEPFLRNLFSDAAIIALPAIFRLPLAWLIARRRAPLARMIYDHMGGRSPILPETEAQARALEAALAAPGDQVRCFIAMRYWHPFTGAAVKAVKAFDPDEIVLLPLYPQFSTTTTRSSVQAWREEAKRQGVKAREHTICCYPVETGFVEAVAELVQQAFARAKSGLSYRVLFSAHGLPKRVVEKGDPYQWQVEQTVAAIRTSLKMSQLDSAICYQSRVGPLEWIGPATTAEIERAGRDGKGLIVVPIAFVSEHSETLVELDIEYGKLARDQNVPDYIRVPTVQTHPAFIGGLATMTRAALATQSTMSCVPGRLCPTGRTCLQQDKPAHA